MRQRAVVLETDGKIAKIEVRRSTMCEGCHKNGGCGEGHCEISGLVSGNGKLETLAENRVNAKVGDTVEVETESKVVLGYAALVFIMPIIVSIVFYYISEALFKADSAGMIGALIGFVLSFVFCVIFDRLKKKGVPDIKIVNIVSDGE
ncbi:MAG: hypothetical protein E7672_00880 [Ruminococcaceae bacterium]|nr:hypothetical protein [Oscillospiraceae bacterium]